MQSEGCGAVKIFVHKILLCFKYCKKTVLEAVTAVKYCWIIYLLNIAGKPIIA